MTKVKMIVLSVAFTISMAQVQMAKAECAPPSFTFAEQELIPTDRIDQVLLSEAIAKETNYYRCERGLKPLAFDPSLKSAAEIHAENMAHLNTLSHVLPVPGNRNMEQRFAAAKVKVTRIRAENVGMEYRFAFGTTPFQVNDIFKCEFTHRLSLKPVAHHSYGSLARSIVKRWWDSPGHRANILEKRVQRIGAAAKFVNNGNAPCGTYYLAQNFAG